MSGLGATFRPGKPAPKPTYPSHFQSDDTFHDRSTVGKGNHQLYRVVQPTEWSRKNALAGRQVHDIRAWELCHKGMAEFSMRLLSEGRFQGTIWTRSVSETVFLTNFMKYLRDEGINIDEIAKSCFSGDQVPDKHRESAKFMQPLVHELGKVLKLKQRECNPDQVSKDEELEHARRKLAAAGIILTPRKRSPEEASAPSGPPLKQARGNEPSSHRGQSKNVEPEPLTDEARAAKLLAEPPVRQVSEPKGSKDAQVEAWVQSYKKVFSAKGQFAEFKKSIDTVHTLLKKHHQKSELVEAAALKQDLLRGSVCAICRRSLQRLNFKPLDSHMWQAKARICLLGNAQTSILMCWP